MLTATQNNNIRGDWYDLATGKRIPWVKAASEETGFYEAYRIDPEVAVKRGIPLREVLYRRQTRLRFVPRPIDATGRVRPRSDGFSVPPPADPVRRGLLGPADPDEECEEPKCHQRAAWFTADVEELPPIFASGKQFGQAKAVRMHYWCWRHYRDPVRKSVRGVEKEVTVLARPQW